MAKTRLSPEMIELVAERFHALGEPARLQIVQALRGGEQTVGELVEATGLATGNVSLGTVDRRVPSDRRALAVRPPSPIPGR